MEDKKPMVCPATCSSHNNAGQTEFVNPDKPKSENRFKKVETICSFELEINEPRLGIFNSGSNELTIPGMLESIDMLRRTFDTIVKLALEEEEDTLQTQKNKNQSTDDRTTQTQINKNQYTDDYTPQTQNNKNQITDDYPKALNECSDLMVIGPNGTTIKRKYYDELLLKDAPEAIRLLCDLIFGDNILATHSLTGNQSRTDAKGRERPPKKQLDPLKTDDITQLICSKFNVSQQLVRSRINTKCTVAAKRLKRLSYKTTL